MRSEVVVVAKEKGPRSMAREFGASFIPLPTSLLHEP